MVVALLLALGPLPATARTKPASAQAASLTRAGDWLTGRQTGEGDLPGYTASGVGELVIALLAGGRPGEPVDRALGYLHRHGARDARSPAHAARIVMGMHAGGADASTHLGVIDAGFDPATGAYEENVYAHALAMVGAAISGDVPGGAVTHLETNQCLSGGFAWRRGCAGVPDTDTTAMAISALRAAGRPADDDAIVRARTYLNQVRNDDGGWGLEPADPTNANSTGLVLSALAALGEDPSSLRPDPRNALAALQTDDGGFAYTEGGAANDYATVQATIGLAGVPYPPPAFQRPTPPSPPATTEPSPTEGAPPSEPDTIALAPEDTPVPPSLAPPAGGVPASRSLAPVVSSLGAVVLAAVAAGAVLYRRRERS